MSVNADKLVQIIPRIIEGGTPGLTFAGLLLSQSELLPAGRVVQFASAQAVANYFGSLVYWSHATTDHFVIPSASSFGRRISADVNAVIAVVPFCGAYLCRVIPAYIQLHYTII